MIKIQRVSIAKRRWINGLKRPPEPFTECLAFVREGAIERRRRTITTGSGKVRRATSHGNVQSSGGRIGVSRLRRSGFTTTR